MVEVVKSYEMVRTFNNFKASVTFAVKKPANMLILIRKFCFDYISPENFFEPPPRSTTFYDLVKILAEVGQKKTTPPPMLMASLRLCL
jgi:hypothetical protein